MASNGPQEMWTARIASAGQGRGRGGHGPPKQRTRRPVSRATSMARHSCRSALGFPSSSPRACRQKITKDIGDRGAHLLLHIPTAQGGRGAVLSCCRAGDQRTDGGLIDVHAFGRWGSAGESRLAGVVQQRCWACKSWRCRHTEAAPTPPKLPPHLLRANPPPRTTALPSHLLARPQAGVAGRRKEPARTARRQAARRTHSHAHIDGEARELCSRTASARPGQRLSPFEAGSGEYRQAYSRDREGADTSPAGGTQGGGRLYRLVGGSGVGGRVLGITSSDRCPGDR